MWEKARVVRLLQRINGLEPTRKHPDIVKKKHGKLAWFKRTFQEFAVNTVLHGYNHIVQANVTKYERQKILLHISTPNEK